MFFPGRMSPEKTDFSWFRRLRPAEVCDACPTGRVRWDGKAGGCLWGVPCRASPLGRKGQRMSMRCALPGESVGAERPADAYGVCPAGRVRWGGKAGGYLWGVPCRASPLGRKGRRIPMGCALPGESVGAERPADAYGVCPAGRVRWGGKAGVYLWGVPCRASPLGRKGRRIPMGCALPGQSVGLERLADACGACPTGRVRWGGRAGGCLRASPLGWRGRRKFTTLFGSVVGMVFLQRAHVFVLGKIFLKLPHIWRGSFVIQGERGRSHHGLGGPI